MEKHIIDIPIAQRLCGGIHNSTGLMREVHNQKTYLKERHKIQHWNYISKARDYIPVLTPLQPVKKEDLNRWSGHTTLQSDSDDM